MTPKFEKKLRMGTEGRTHGDVWYLEHLIREHLIRVYKNAITPSFARYSFACVRVCVCASGRTAAEAHTHTHTQQAPPIPRTTTKHHHACVLLHERTQSHCRPNAQHLHTSISANEVGPSFAYGPLMCRQAAAYEHY